MSSNNPGDNNPGSMGADSGSVSGGRVRPIDAPDLPAWRVRGSSKPPPEVDSEEDAPTQSVLDRPPALDPRVLAAEDPRALARKLAEEAKLRMTAAGGAGQPPVPQREPQERKEEPTMSAEDPRELARRLAEEAKRRLREPAPEPAMPPEPSFAREPFFGESGDEATPYGASDDEDGPAIRVVDERPAADRVASTSRPLTALEALALAREQEKRAKASQPPPRSHEPPQSAPQPAPSSVSALQREPSQSHTAQREAVSAAPRSGPAPLGQVATIVRRVFAEAEVEPALPVSNPEVFRALWRAHGARALHEGDIHLVATASVLLDAVGRVPPGWLAAARMRINGSYWAVFVDLERGVLLGVARPAEVYLAGMG